MRTVTVHHGKYRSGRILIHFGYDKGKSIKLAVNPEQAEIVRLIYRLFLERMSLYFIAKHLTALGIKTPMNKEKWHGTTVQQILTKEKYKDDALLQKTLCSDFLTKKSIKNEGQIPMYYIMRRLLSLHFSIWYRRR